jgi:nicotinamidase-related amidase
MRQVLREMRNYVGSPEYDILPEVAPIPGEGIVTKTSSGAFASSSIDSVLRALGAQQLYLNGVSSNMCVDTTGREAADVVIW